MSSAHTAWGLREAAQLMQLMCQVQTSFADFHAATSQHPRFTLMTTVSTAHIALTDKLGWLKFIRACRCLTCGAAMRYSRVYDKSTIEDDSDNEGRRLTHAQHGHGSDLSRGPWHGRLELRRSRSLGRASVNDAIRSPGCGSASPTLHTIH